jgi:hypothetical protein
MATGSAVIPGTLAQPRAVYPRAMAYELEPLVAGELGGEFGEAIFT